MPSTEPLLPRRAWLPAAVTAANIAAGFIAMLAASADRFEIAVYLLLLAILLDMMDGRVARRLRATSAFGQQLDSFSDALSFGAAPAFLVYASCLQRLGALGVSASLLYVLAGVFRLARFNLFSDAHDKPARTLGVPIPIGAGYLMVLVLMRDAIPAAAAAVVVVLMAGGMGSRWRLPDLKGKNAVSAMLLVGMLNYFAVVFHPGWATVIWWNGWNLVILIAAQIQNRRWLARDLGAEAPEHALESVREALDP